MNEIRVFLFKYSALLRSTELMEKKMCHFCLENFRVTNDAWICDKGPHNNDSPN